MKDKSATGNMRGIFVAALLVAFALGFVAWLIWPRQHEEVKGAAAEKVRSTLEGIGRETVRVALLSRERGPRSGGEAETPGGAFTDLHDFCLGRFLEELNQHPENEKYQFTLQNYDLGELSKAAGGGEGPVDYYKALFEVGPEIDLVIDNTRGGDLEQSRDTIVRSPVPILSLNAVRIGEYGESIVFLGSGTMIREKVSEFIGKALMGPSTGMGRTRLILLTEEGYDLSSSGTEAVRYTYEDEIAKHVGSTTGLMTMPFDVDAFDARGELTNPGEFARIRDALKTSFESGGHDEIILVLNTHQVWGTELTKWVLNWTTEASLRGPVPKVTLIGHDTAVNAAVREEITTSEGSGGNFSLILLKTPNPEYMARTFEKYQLMRDRTPDLLSETAARHQGKQRYNGFPGFPKETASIFIRRCLAASEIIEQAYLAAPGDRQVPEEEDPAKYLGRAFLEGLHEAKPGVMRNTQGGSTLLVDDLGFLHFNEFGEEEGSLAFQVYAAGRKPMPHLMQLNARGKVIPALQIAINDFQIRRVDVERGEFDADFVCSTTISSTGKMQVLNVLQRLREKEVALGDESLTGDPRGKLVEYPMLSGLLSIPNMRSGTVAQIGQTDASAGSDSEYRVYKVRGTFAADLDTKRYPFDSHHLGVELQAAVPEEHLTLASQQTGATRLDRDQRGWNVNWIHPLVENRVADNNPTAAELGDSASRQFKEYAIMVDVKRDITQPILVVMLPLILLGFSAIGILFLKKDSMGKSPSELAMGIVLAVVAYSISYADVVPRSGGWTESDLLYLVTVLVCMFNFGAVLLFGELGDSSDPLDRSARWRARYSSFVLVSYLVFLVIWCNSGGVVWYVEQIYETMMAKRLGYAMEARLLL